jgi:hypothetical protein
MTKMLSDAEEARTRARARARGEKSGVGRGLISRHRQLPYVRSDGEQELSWPPNLFRCRIFSVQAKTPPALLFPRGPSFAILCSISPRARSFRSSAT